MSDYKIYLRDTVTLVLSNDQHLTELTVEGLPALNNGAWVLVDHEQGIVRHVKEYKFLILTNKFVRD